jgi:hypothetical protein
MYVRREQSPSPSRCGDREPEDPELIEELYPPDFVWHGPDRDIRSYELAEQSAAMFLAAFPDAHITDEDVIAEGDKVVRRYTTRGTHQGQTEMFGPPQGGR